MSDTATSKPLLPGEVQEYLQFWSDGLAKVLGQVAGSPFTAEPAVPPELPPSTALDLQLLAVCAGTVRGEMLLRLPGTTTVQFAQWLLGEPPDAAAECTPERREAAEELLRQVAGHVATSLKSRWGEVQLRVEPGATPAWPEAAQGWISISAGTTCLWLEYRLSAALVAALRPSPVPPAATAGRSHDSTLDLLMDVQLEATLRFGGRRMLLREILELDSGSVVELDRQVQQAADLLLDGRLIARGEVVMVEGSYGLRVTEVVSLAESAPGSRT
jgi:flagellar motor switch protein FliN/FliY